MQDRGLARACRIRSCTCPGFRPGAGGIFRGRLHLPPGQVKDFLFQPGKGIPPQGVQLSHRQEQAGGEIDLCIFHTETGPAGLLKPGSHGIPLSTGIFRLLRHRTGRREGKFTSGDFRGHGQFHRASRYKHSGASDRKGPLCPDEGIVEPAVQFVVSFPEIRLLAEINHFRISVAEIIALCLSAPVKELQKLLPVFRIHMVSFCSFRSEQIQIFSPDGGDACRISGALHPSFDLEARDA